MTTSIRSVNIIRKGPVFVIFDLLKVDHFRKGQGGSLSVGISNYSLYLYI